MFVYVRIGMYAPLHVLLETYTQTPVHIYTYMYLCTHVYRYVRMRVVHKSRGARCTYVCV